MKTHQSLVVAASLIMSTVASATAVEAQDQSVLDPTQHPNSPNYQSVYPPKIIPLDAKLSWTNRFEGNETFNENEVLEQVATTITQPKQQMNHDPEHATTHQMNMDGVGVIKQIKAEQGKIKLKHGPIDRLGMPAMTMVFKIEDTSQLDGLVKDQEVGFSVDNSSGGFVVTRIMAMSSDGTGMSMGSESGKTSKMDATGTIKTIRSEQGKVKIEHGPIERLGMPAMTMMFKVNDPATLIGLEKGDSVRFSVDNSAGGFVITDIESAE